MPNDRVFPHPRLMLCALLLLLHAFLWLATGYLPMQANPYHSYALQAQSWLNGRLDVDYCSWLEQAICQGRYYISFPPLPSVILLPFVALFGVSTPDHLLTFLAALIGALCAFDMAKKSGRQDGACVFWALFVTAGSNLIFVSMLGWVWYMAQTFAFAFTMAAFAGAVSGQEARMRRSLFYLACAVGCRPLNLLFFPVLFYLIWQRLPQKTPGTLLRRWYWLIAPGCVAVFLCALNAARFGSITEFGHNYLPEFLESPDGQFSLTYLPYNLFRCVRLYTGNFEIPRFDGWAFYLVMPIYICALASPLLSKRRPDTLFWLTIVVMLAHLCFTCAHKTLGGWHFGCRYLIDALPLAYLLCMQTRRDCAVRRLDAVLMAAGLIVNLCGTVWFYLY